MALADLCVRKRNSNTSNYIDRSTISAKVGLQICYDSSPSLSGCREQGQGHRGPLIVGMAPTFNGLTRNSSSTGLESSIFIDTHFRGPENTSGFASISVIKRKDNESETSGKDRDGVNGNFTTVQEISAPVSETSSFEEKKSGAISLEKTEVQSSEKIAEETRQATSQEKTETPIKEGIEKKKKGPTTVTNMKASRNERIKASRNERIKENNMRECDITKGRWVYDASYPLYSSCPSIDEGFDCVGNGRLDKDYMKWRWQPQDCNIPRFNATKMLDLIRGKRLVFVGDSINRNQWESMLCMLMEGVKDPKKVYETHGRKITKEKGNYSFKFVDYKCTVEYHVTHFLVHESKAKVGSRRVQTLRIDAIDHGTSRWRGADVLIFNTAHWWSHFKTKAGINYYQEGNQVHPQLDVSTAFRRALLTWASWVDRHVNPRKTEVFFRSSAPSHFRGGQWNSGGHCKEATHPLNETSSISYSEKDSIVEDIIKRMKTPVTFLNITSFSGFRIDGHPSIYGKRPSKRSSIQDCSHWCLPGVPDTWNEFLYFHLLSKQGGTFQ
ncbi:unnamed protein product [Dovyalis caffra]|uniref:Trichome birefringence-like N-terminal domain-containing protein n=1 Tax=Dovyalis caffra TaxID=77055 RepID=A0AAV1SAX6_9ROSI|nr:unnamed protein product [Dovyalis caffra]